MRLLALDTTESRLAQEALHRSELRFREVTETLFDPLVILSPIRNDSGDVVDFDFTVDTTEKQQGRNSIPNTVFRTLSTLEFLFGIESCFQDFDP